MAVPFDLVIRGGTVVDGSGGPEYIADIGVSGGVIAGIGDGIGPGVEEIDASGLLVTPGFVDIHSHYDGQVTWDERTAPSSDHGVTTVVMGNCGVGFAPCRPGDRDTLLRVMEGVEDIPEIVMTEGLPWNWETFPEYLDAIAARARDIDVAAQLPHSCLRVYVMGERAASGEPATAEDLAEMTRLAREAMEAGAIGFGTSRTMFHKSSDGAAVPSYDAGRAELAAIGQGLAQAGKGVLQAVIDLHGDALVEAEVKLLRGIAEETGRPASFSLAQVREAPQSYARALELVDAAQADGVALRAQVIGRPTGILVGLDLSYNPFSLHPSYREIQNLALAERLERMRRPEVRAAILSERPGEDWLVHLKYLTEFDRMFPLADPPQYEFSPEDSVAARAARAGISAEELAYDLLLEDDGRAVLSIAFANFADGTLDAALAMLRHPHTLMGLGDGGAHCGMICDAGYPTFMLTHWARDRNGERLALVDVVKGLSRDPAEAVGLLDRGLIAEGYKADINVIDFANLRLKRPEVTYDLPAGGRRLIQRAHGYAATIVNGHLVARHAVPTGALPGRLVRGAQPAPSTAHVKDACHV